MLIGVCAGMASTWPVATCWSRATSAAEVLVFGGRRLAGQLTRGRHGEGRSPRRVLAILFRIRDGSGRAMCCYARTIASQPCIMVLQHEPHALPCPALVPPQAHAVCVLHSGEAVVRVRRVGRDGRERRVLPGTRQEVGTGWRGMDVAQMPLAGGVRTIYFFVMQPFTAVKLTTPSHPRLVTMPTRGRLTTAPPLCPASFTRARPGGAW